MNELIPPHRKDLPKIGVENKVELYAKALELGYIDQF